MTLVISKKNIQNLEKILNEKFDKTKKTGNISAHFGKLKRNIDGLKYQLEQRKK